jgi:WD40 repeat protein/serine/threonine protein kinase
VAYNKINGAANALTWQPGDVLFDLYEVRPVVEGLGDAAEEKSCHRGGFGQVYKVYHRGWNLELAMKAPLPGVFENEAQVEDFTRECETWVELGLHPHIVTCYYVRNLSGQPLVFAEYVAGGSLKEWIDSGLLYEGGLGAALKRILDIVIQTARGLHYAHEQGLVHQDVKPANIMLTLEGQAKISDFGAARARARAAANTDTDSPGTILVSRGGMTPAYCSPEQTLGEKLTRRTDIWSWGLTVLEMFTGEVTWASGVAAAQALEAYNNHGSEAEEIPPMPQDLALLLERCFKSEQERPQNFKQVIVELMPLYHKCCGLGYPRAVPKAAPDSADSLNNRALSMHDLGRAEEAEKLWEEALKHDPAHLAATYNRGLIKWRGGKIDDVVLVQRLEELRKGQPTVRAAYLLALIHAERLDYRSALELLEEANTVAGDDYEIGITHKRLKPLVDKGARCLRVYKGHTGVISACLSTDGRYILAGYSNKSLRLWELSTGECLRNFEEPLDYVSSISLSADGIYALTASDIIKWPLFCLLPFEDQIMFRDRTIKLWDVRNGKCVRTFEGHTFVTAAYLSADGCYAIAGSLDTLMLWDAVTGKSLRIFEGHNDCVNSVCLSADSRYALSGSNDKSLKLWDVESGNCLRTFEGHTGVVNSVCLSVDGRYALSGGDKTLKLWDAVTGKCLRTFEGHTGVVNSVCLSVDGRYALSGSEDNTLKLWEVESGRCLRTYTGHTGGVISVYFSPDDQSAISVSKDKTLKLWNLPWLQAKGIPNISQLETSAVLRSENAFKNEEEFKMYLSKIIIALQEGNTDEVLLTLRQAWLLPGRARDRQLFELWKELYPYYRRSKLIDSWELRVYEGHNGPIKSVSLSADGRYALSGSYDETLKLWEIENGECLRTLTGHYWRNIDSEADSQSTDNGNGQIVNVVDTLSYDQYVSLLQGYSINSVFLGSDGEIAITSSGCPGLNMGMIEMASCVDNDESKFVYGPSEIRVWNIVSGRCLLVLGGHLGNVWSVCLSHDNCYALSGGEDATLKLWDVKTGVCLHTFRGHHSNVYSVSFSPDGRYALSGSGDATLKLWDVKTGVCLHTFIGHGSVVNSVCFSPDGRYALSGSVDKTIKLWDVKTGDCLRTFIGHESIVNSVCFSSDSRYALSGSYDKSLKLWDVSRGLCLRTFEGHSGGVNAVCFSYDSSYLVSASSDNTLKLWELYWDLE